VQGGVEGKSGGDLGGERLGLRPKDLKNQWGEGRGGYRSVTPKISCSSWDPLGGLCEVVTWWVEEKLANVGLTAKVIGRRKGPWQKKKGIGISGVAFCERYGDGCATACQRQGN